MATVTTAPLAAAVQAVPAVAAAPVPAALAEVGEIVAAHPVALAAAAVATALTGVMDRAVHPAIAIVDK